jgi:hypothetical protein
MAKWGLCAIRKIDEDGLRMRCSISNKSFNGRLNGPFKASPLVCYQGDFIFGTSLLLPYIP